MKFLLPELQHIFPIIFSILLLVSMPKSRGRCAASSEGRTYARNVGCPRQYPWGDPCQIRGMALCKMRGSTRQQPFPFTGGAARDQASGFSEGSGRRLCEVAEAIRALIGGIVLTPGPNRGEVHASLRGELVAILDLAKGSAAHRTGGGNGVKSEYSALMTEAMASPGRQSNHGRASAMCRCGITPAECNGQTARKP